MERNYVRRCHRMCTRALSLAEQNSPAVFNKAAMMNVGFVEASRRFAAMDCVMFHDVDQLLEDDRALMNCAGQLPHHYAISIDEWNYRCAPVTVVRSSLALSTLH